MFAAMPPQRCTAAGALVLIALAAQPVPLVASSCPSAACRVSAEDEAGAALGLLQFSSKDASSYRGGAGAGVGTSAGEVASEVGDLSAEEARLLRSRLASRGLGSAVEALPEMNCTLHQAFCEAPFNCQSNPPTLQEMWTWNTVRIATEDGHSNIRSWCMPDALEYVGGNAYEDASVLCLKNHDLKGFARLAYNLSVEDGSDGLDGSYCFLEHCTNTDVTNDTTLEEAEALCDAKYGHENWTSLSFATVLKRSMLHPFDFDTTGFKTRDISATFGMLACAMGNFQCDVMYCKDNYCKNPHYVERYGHLLKE